MKLRAFLLLPVLPLLAACGETADLPWTAGTGQNPQLPMPRRTLLPTMQIAKAVGWSEGAMPTPAAGWPSSCRAGRAARASGNRG